MRWNMARRLGVVGVSLSLPQWVYPRALETEAAELWAGDLQDRRRPRNKGQYNRVDVQERPVWTQRPRGDDRWRDEHDSGDVEERPDWSYNEGGTIYDGVWGDDYNGRGYRNLTWRPP